MAKSILSQNTLKSLTHYDPITGLLTWRVNNGRARSGNECGRLHLFGYRTTCIQYVHYKVHRLIYLYMTGNMPKEIDHINHVRDDNRWNNLREVTRTQNSMNRSKSTNNTSGVTGVFKMNYGPGGWRAGIKINGKNIHIGVSQDFDEAVAMRKAAENEYGFHKNHGG